jgi:putative ABC transport system ATP-binding protein
VSAPLLAFERVTVAGVDHPRLSGVDLEIPDGVVTVVVGPSGAGKSTLLRLANRLEVPDAGTVRFRGTDIAHLDVSAHRRELGMLFQRPVVFPGTVLDNLRVAEPRLDTAGAASLLARVRLDVGFLDRNTATLSGGEAQRMCLARALAAGPHALLLDEPTAALDAEPRLALEHLVRELCAAGIPSVWVTHDLRQMERLADHVVVLLGGRVAHQSSSRPFVADAPPEAARFLEASS